MTLIISTLQAASTRPAGNSRYARVRLCLTLVLVLACHTAAASQSNTAISNRASPPGEASIVATPQYAAGIRLNQPSPQVAEVARWVAKTHDNGVMPYVIIDKINAEVFVFGIDGHLQATAPALLGLARGDRSVEGVGDRKLPAIQPLERITPAGRFLASLGMDARGEELLWIDYKDAIALHAVVKGTPQEHRAERLASATPADNRISYGCVNVPPAFYHTYISTAFRRTNALVYILPEASAASAFFGYGKASTGLAPTAPIGSALAR